MIAPPLSSKIKKERGEMLALQGRKPRTGVELPTSSHLHKHVSYCFNAKQNIRANVFACPAHTTTTHTLLPRTYTSTVLFQMNKPSASTSTKKLQAQEKHDVYCCAWEAPSKRQDLPGTAVCMTNNDPSHPTPKGLRAS